ncbi:MAG: chemotaxis protein CheW [Eubacterium sp.]|nr:chemotaxis protein CheW [Eubacterium sp.]
MREIIAFEVGDKKFGFDISCMRSLENYREITPVPGTPSCILGQVQVRDTIYPVFDLHTMLGMPKREVTETTKMIIVTSGELSLVCVLDSVDKVFKLTDDKVKEFPEVARTEGTRYVDYVVNYNDELMLILDPKTMISPEDYECVCQTDFE